MTINLLKSLHKSEQNLKLSILMSEMEKIFLNLIRLFFIFILFLSFFIGIFFGTHDNFTLNLLLCVSFITLCLNTKSILNNHKIIKSCLENNKLSIFYLFIQFKISKLFRIKKLYSFFSLFIAEKNTPSQMNQLSKDINSDWFSKVYTIYVYYNYSKFNYNELCYVYSVLNNNNIFDFSVFDSMEECDYFSSDFFNLLEAQRKKEMNDKLSAFN
jgi:hypothetical protein